ncbi:DUF2793 domain-containing protein [Rhodobacteraceae bacterium F11138]|nr:DUF2793 domain-containing protein [Rhodobacteraceae bacterium F11138]
MPDNSPILALPFLMPSQAQKHVTHNEALRRLDILVQLRVTAFEATTPPSAPAEGEAHALGIDPVAAWAGHAQELAVWLDGVWHFLPPQEGWRAWGLTERQLRVWTGSEWIVPPSDANNLPGLGVGTASDASNRLSVRSEATLFSHEGSDHRLKINKAAAADTASVLFQSDWTGHAEMGLAGNTDFAIKLSEDGASWTEALRFDAASGRASGAAVQAGPLDATQGRLMMVGGFGVGTQAAPILTDLEATDSPSGFYRLTAATLNRPAGAGDGVVCIQRHDSGTFLQQVTLKTGETLQRFHSGGSFTGWSMQYGSGNLLGEVAQTGGVPTGAVIERGANTAGEYVRFADGTQICTRTVRQTGQDLTTGYGALRRSGNLLAGNTDLPMPFVAPPVFTASVRIDNSATMFAWGGTGDEDTLPPILFAVSPFSITNRDITADILITGRWF